MGDDVNEESQLPVIPLQGLQPQKIPKSFFKSILFISIVSVVVFLLLAELVLAMFKTKQLASKPPKVSSYNTEPTLSPSPTMVEKTVDKEYVWEPICSNEKVGDITITSKNSESLTTIARNALITYLNEAGLVLQPNPAPMLTSEEKVYAEDYIRKGLPVQQVRTGEVITVPCSLAEEAALKSRFLSLKEEGNLEQYANKVTNYQEQQMIQDILNQNPLPTGVHTTILNLGHQQ